MAIFTVRVTGPDGFEMLLANVSSTNFKDAALTCLTSDGQVMQFGPFPAEMVTGPTPVATVMSETGHVIGTYDLLATGGA